MNNYPDDIHSYDDNPLSPTYTGPEGANCKQCGNYTDYNDMVEDDDVCLECYKAYTCKVCDEYHPDTVDVNDVCEACQDACV